MKRLILKRIKKTPYESIFYFVDATTKTKILADEYSSVSSAFADAVRNGYKIAEIENEF